MKIFHSKPFFLVICFLLTSATWLCAGDDDFPVFARRSLRSRGCLSSSVVKPALDNQQMLDDIPFNMDVESLEVEDNFDFEGAKEKSQQGEAAVSAAEVGGKDQQVAVEENSMMLEASTDSAAKIDAKSVSTMSPSDQASTESDVTAPAIEPEIESQGSGEKQSPEEFPEFVANSNKEPKVEPNSTITPSRVSGETSSSVSSQQLPESVPGQQKEAGKSLPPEKEYSAPKGENIPVAIDPEPVVSVDQERIIQQAENDDEEIAFNFENADLINLVTYIEMLFGVKFIPDDIVSPTEKGVNGVEGHKISFKTHKPLTKQQAWSLFLTFLDMAKLSVVPQADPKLYRIVSSEKAKTSPIPSYIGVDAELLPDNDSKIRFVYFAKNADMTTLKTVIDSLKSSTTPAIQLVELKAFILIDSAYNIKSLMRIVREIDKVTMPQAMSVLKLKRVDAQHVFDLYKSLTGDNQQQQGRGRLFGPRRSSTTLYFPEHARMVVESRTNSLILLGTREDIKKIEEFITTNIDVDANMPYSPLHVYQLKYADAVTVANIMNEMMAFGREGAAGDVGGVRGEDKYLKPMTFTPEGTGNRLVIRGDYEDYVRVKEIIERLDEPQPQVAIEVLIVSVGVTDIKELGSQLRNKLRSDDFKSDGLLGKNINFQTSGIRLGSTAHPIVEKTNTSGATRLLGDLVSLVTGSSAGNTILSLGSDDFGVWGIFHALKTISNAQVISNPFLIATNKTKATVSLGETRNVQTSTILGQQSVPTYNQQDALLKVEVTPQINSDGMIILKLNVSINAFRADTASVKDAQTTKVIRTSTIVADKEVLALGGLIKNKVENSVNKNPFWGNIPILGWLGKNKKKSEVKEDLLVLLSARIIDPNEKTEADLFTKGHVGDYKSTVSQMRNVHLRRDPIDRVFFDEKKGDVSRRIDKFIFNRDKKTKKKKKSRRRKKKKSVVVQKTSAKDPVVIAQSNSRSSRRRSRRQSSRKKGSLHD